MCGICGKINKNYLCQECTKSIVKLEKNELTLYNNQENFYNKHMYIFNYEGIIRKSILNYKFNDKAYIYRTFEKIILNNKKICDFINSYDIIIPVPIHNKRKLKRGYNQSELIIKQLLKDEKKIEKYKNNILTKTKNNPKQSTLSKIDRASNVINAYKINVKKANILVNKKILIFDDIYTTGNTIKECAKQISQYNPKEIGTLTIAKD